MVGMSPRPYLIEEYTRTVCPFCPAKCSNEFDAFVDGMLVSHSGKVWMRRFCAVHGETESLYEEDLEIWRARHGWSTPTLSSNPIEKTTMLVFPMDIVRASRQAMANTHAFSCSTLQSTATTPARLAMRQPLPPEPKGMTNCQPWTRSSTHWTR